MNRKHANVNKIFWYSGIYIILNIDVSLKTKYGSNWFIFNLIHFKCWNTEPVTVGYCFASFWKYRLSLTVVLNSISVPVSQSHHTASYGNISSPTNVSKVGMLHWSPLACFASFWEYLPSLTAILDSQPVLMSQFHCMITYDTLHFICPPIVLHSFPPSDHLSSLLWSPSSHLQASLSCRLGLDHPQYL